MRMLSKIESAEDDARNAIRVPADNGAANFYFGKKDLEGHELISLH
jgi:hypothetical protein